MNTKSLWAVWKTSIFWDKRKTSLECLCPRNPQYDLNHRIKTTGRLRHVESWLYMCDSVPLAKADARQCVSLSLQPQERRDGSDFSKVYDPQEITMAKVTLFCCTKKPLDKQRYGSVSISPVYCFSPHTPCFVLCPHFPALPICRSRTWRTYLGKPWALGSWIHPGRAQPEDSSGLGHNRAQEPQGWSQQLGLCSGWWRG